MGLPLNILGITGKSLIKNGLILYLDAGNNNSYSGSGTNWVDISGSANNGTLINGTSYNSNNGGNLVFDGVDDYVNISNIINPGTGSFSFGCWVKTSTTAITGFIGKSILLAVVGRFSLLHSTAVPNKLRAIIGFDTNGTILNSTSNINDGKWHYAFITLNRTGNATLYFDGISETSTNISSFSSVNMTYNQPIRAGVYNDASYNPANFLNGSISMIHYYNRALTASEVLQNYNATKNRFI